MLCTDCAHFEDCSGLACVLTVAEANRPDCRENCTHGPCDDCAAWCDTYEPTDGIEYVDFDESKISASHRPPNTCPAWNDCDDRDKGDGCAGCKQREYYEG